jgi:hypothetical protein
MFNAVPPANGVSGSDLDWASHVRYYSIVESPSGATFTLGAVKLSYDTDDGVTIPSSLRVAQGPPSGSGNWLDMGGTGSGSPSGTITSSVAFTDLTTNTVFTLGTVSPDNPLPVEMISFTAAASPDDGITLHWSMASELNNSGWDVERATVDAAGNVSAFTKIGHVKGTLNSVVTTNYSFLDRTALYGTFEYTLNQIDINGNSKLSNTIKVAQLVLPKTVQLSAYPNPFNPTATLRYALPEAGKVVIAVYNSIGQLVTTVVNKNADAGIFEVSLNGSSLPSGVYFARLSFAGAANSTVRISKLMLVK